MTATAIYARVSSARQAKDQTIGSQLSALREHAATSRLDVPEDWVFADEGHSGATLARPALEALRDLAAGTQKLVPVANLAREVGRAHAAHRHGAAEG